MPSFSQTGLAVSLSFYVASLSPFVRSVPVFPFASVNAAWCAFVLHRKYR